MKIIETERLILRKYLEEDILKLAAINEDEEVMEFFPKLYDLTETQDFIVLQNEQIDEKGFGFFALEEKESAEFIGFVGLNQVSFEADFAPAVEIGWRIAADKWNLGYATEAAKAVLEFGFDKIGLEQIVAFSPKLNKKSQRVMEKVGMKRDEGGNFLHPQVAKDHALEEHILYYGQKKDFWRL